MFGRTKSFGVWRGACLLLALATGPVAFGQAINTFSIGQLTWRDSGGVPYAPYSAWGELTVNVTPDTSSIYYLNLGAKAAGSGSSYSWMVQNLPVFSASVIGDVNQTVYVDLEDLPGFVAGSFVGNLDLTLSLDPTPQASLSGNIFANNVTPAISIRQASEDKLGTPPTSVSKPMGHKTPGPGATATNIIQHRNVPSVQEGNRQCLAGSLARSLKWLDNQYDLPGLPNDKSAQDVFVTLTGPTYKVSDPNTSYMDDVAAKQRYFKTLHPAGVTKILDLANAIGEVEGVTQTTDQDLVTWLYRELPTEDVELHYDTHIVTLTGIYRQGNKVFVRYRDDEYQGNDEAGDASEKDAEVYAFDGVYYFNRTMGPDSPVKVVISESVPEPSSLGLAGAVAALALGRRWQYAVAQSPVQDIPADFTSASARSH